MFDVSHKFTTGMFEPFELGDWQTDRWCFASMSIDHPRLRKTLGEGVKRSVRQLSAIDLASIAWSLAILQWHDGILATWAVNGWLCLEPMFGKVTQIIAPEVLVT